MIYKILLGKNEISIGEDDKSKIINNIDKNFIVLNSGEVINPSFVQGIIIDHEGTKQERKELKMLENSRMIAPQVEKMIEGSISKFKPDFLK
jgi:hypothetical protein